MAKHTIPRTKLWLPWARAKGPDLALRAVVSPGDEVLIPEPSYVSYHPCVTLCDGVPVSVKTEPKDDFKLTPQNILNALTPKKSHNHSGIPTTPRALLWIRRDPGKNNPYYFRAWLLIVISDEDICFLTYGQYVSIASLERKWRGKDAGYQRLFQSFCNDRLEIGIFDRAQRGY